MHTSMRDDIEPLLQFLKECPTSEHTAAYLSKALKASKLEENSPFSLKAGHSYFVKRGGAVIAFRLPEHHLESMVIIGSHTDSPALKLKPKCKPFENVELLSTEVYGSPHIPSWMARELVISGKIIFEEHGSIKEKLVHLSDMPCVLANAPIHLDGSPNQEGFKLDRESHLRPIMGLNPKATLEELLKVKNLLGFDLFLVPLDGPCLVGREQEIISSYRIDNLSSVFATLQAFNEAKPRKETLQMAIFWDHEEIGSETEEGASSPFFQDILERIYIALKLGGEQPYIIAKNSFCISMDVAHAHHPNYSSLFDESNSAKLGKGVAIKTSAKRRYATSASSAARFTHLMQTNGVPHQFYFGHSSKPSGSTIGHIFAAKTGIETVDVGAAILGMHSIKEQMAKVDFFSLVAAAQAAFKEG
jgi:aspartyl aminopeptidase